MRGAMYEGGIYHCLKAGHQICIDDNQVMLRRSSRVKQKRRFMRPDVGPDSSWVDAPTTTEEETSKASIPRFVGVGNGFVPVAKSTDEGQIVEGSVVR
jgi:hypothetical protein